MAAMTIAIGAINLRCHSQDRHMVTMVTVMLLAQMQNGVLATVVSIDCQWYQWKQRRKRCQLSTLETMVPLSPMDVHLPLSPLSLLLPTEPFPFDGDPAVISPFNGTVVAFEMAPMVTNGDHHWCQWWWVVPLAPLNAFAIGDSGSPFVLFFVIVANGEMSNL